MFGGPGSRDQHAATRGSQARSGARARERRRRIMALVSPLRLAQPALGARAGDGADVQARDGRDALVGVGVVPLVPGLGLELRLPAPLLERVAVRGVDALLH